MLPEFDGEMFVMFGRKLWDIIQEQFTTFILPFDKETLDGIIEDMIGVVDDAIEMVEEDESDGKIYESIKRYLNSITDVTRNNIVKIIAKIQGLPTFGIVFRESFLLYYFFRGVSHGKYGRRAAVRQWYDGRHP